MKRKCKMCKSVLVTRFQILYCSNQCQSLFQYQNFIDGWKKGILDGGMGISTKTISRHIKHYLLEKNNEKCSLCGWSKKHPITVTVPLEIDHIDGDSENNREINLRLLCPNCHALTPFFKNLNMGKGRAWRKKKYIKNK